MNVSAPIRVPISLCELLCHCSIRTYLDDVKVPRLLLWRGWYSTLLPSSMRSMLRQLQQPCRASRAGRVFSVTYTYSNVIGCKMHCKLLMYIFACFSCLIFPFLWNFVVKKSEKYGEPYLVRHKSTDLVRIGGLDLVRLQYFTKLYLVRQEFAFFHKTIPSPTGITIDNISETKAYFRKSFKLKCV